MSVPASAALQVDSELQRAFARMRPRLVLYAQRVAGPDLAEDVVQEVFLRLLRYRGEGAAQVSLPFALAATRNVARTMLSERSRVERARSYAQRWDRPVYGPAPSELEGCVAELLATLSTRQREALLMTDGFGLSESQAGRALSMSRAAISARRRAAIRRLRDSAA